jgi:hypothetical protein
VQHCAEMVATPLQMFPALCIWETVLFVGQLSVRWHFNLWHVLFV